eukprot:NODE_14315_length_240_cov_10.424084_g13402_i0.p3 GENE.NODE_14315_length_240_cov_10.424084_g13402_i0~~NODE_14315_length_240_cov_10.424084_g13402_i0.p3  ORF type:complete len:50 (-),score=7.56 NODE_14315_length_240_cov_10.424084_g13402_i0:60-209(-)
MGEFEFSTTPGGYRGIRRQFPGGSSSDGRLPPRSATTGSLPASGPKQCF